jgi:molybdopterin-synthase adenylyltransferase
MEPSELLVRRATRMGREFQFILDADLHTWALEAGLSLRRAMAATLQAGVFPECLERNFPSLSIEEQARLFDASALVAGLGGLGGTLALLLARMGVGRLLLADGDVFAPSNLNRQFLATGRSLGLNKARAASDDLQDINPALLVVPIPYYLTPENLPDYVAEVEIVLDGLDSVSARRDLFAAAQQYGVPLVHGAVVGRYGQVATVLPGDADGFARLYPDTASEPAGGREILAPVAALTAGLQALEAVRLLLGQPPAYHGRLAHFDGDTGVLELLPLG